jgi:hypothetical protein
VQRYDIASRELANSASLLVSLVDGRGEAVPAGEARVDSGAWVRGSARAPIRLAGLAGGSHVLEARAVGGATHAWSVRLHAGRAVRATLSLAPGGARTRLAAVRVVAARPSRFEQHRASGQGQYIDQAEIAARGYPQLIDLLRTVPGVRVVRAQSDGGRAGEHFELELRGASLLASFVTKAGATSRGDPGTQEAPRLTPATADQTGWTGNRCQVVIYLDGSQVYFPKDMPTSDVLRSLVPTSQIVGIEVYPSGAAIPAEYAALDAACGVIAIWTGREGSAGNAASAPSATSRTP